MSARTTVHVGPRHGRAFMALFHWYARRLVARHFGAMRVRGALAPPEAGPTVYVVNHTAWWDPIAIYLLSRDEPRVRHDALMAEQGLRRFPFFARIGAVAVPEDRGTVGMRAMLAYLDAWRAHPGGATALWVFPQGRVRHAAVRPLGVEPGAARIVRRAAPCNLAPVALAYEFGEAQHPMLWASIGRPVAVTAPGERVDVEALLTREVDALHGDLVAGRDAGFRTLVAGRAGVADRYERARSVLSAGGRSGGVTP